MSQSLCLQLLVATLIGGWAIPCHVLPRITPPPPDVSTHQVNTTAMSYQQSVDALPKVYRPMPLRTQGGGTR